MFEKSVNFIIKLKAKFWLVIIFTSIFTKYVLLKIKNK